ncbi:hypothetical protein GCM10010339_69240 [Streptomyces alanosinicus]|uniref:Uncharacterized protein n=1 Tax=Streptomyces alanosinicus TaxID=68171 RepID=A0A918YQA2_9ACTN|nr:hypothetical protein GCM10010339_69240 [Streptomyces alanosinicus]
MLLAEGRPSLASVLLDAARGLITLTEQNRTAGKCFRVRLPELASEPHTTDTTPTPQPRDGVDGVFPTLAAPRTSQ